MSRRAAIAIGTTCICGVMLASIHAVFAAKSHTTSPAKTVITAEVGTLKLRGNAFTATFDKKVRVSSTEGGATSTLTSQRLTATGTDGQIAAAKAEYDVNVTSPMLIDGNKYLVEIHAQAIPIDRGSGLIQLKKMSGKPQPQLMLTPADPSNRERIRLQADFIEFSPDALNARKESSVFLRAKGKMTFLVISRSKGDFMGREAEYQQMEGSAPAFVGSFVKVAGQGSDDTPVQLFQFSKEGTVEAGRPHLKISDYAASGTVGVQWTTIDANSINFYPNNESIARKLWQTKPSGAVQPIPVLVATGRTTFRLLREDADPGKNSKSNSSFALLPKNQLWRGDYGNLYYQLLPSKDNRPFDNIIRWTGDQPGINPWIVMVDADDPAKLPRYVETTKAYFNLDTEAMNLGMDQEYTPEEAQ